jgi:hypothetical protein
MNMSATQVSCQGVGGGDWQHNQGVASWVMVAIERCVQSGFVFIADLVESVQFRITFRPLTGCPRLKETGCFGGKYEWNVQVAMVVVHVGEQSYISFHGGGGACVSLFNQLFLR